MSSIFISYSSKDVEAGTRLRDLLAARGYAAVFRDKDEEHGIAAGTKWAEELFAHLERADIVVFLASAASLASPWCHTELAVGVARGKHMVQVSLHKEPVHPVLADRQALPPEPDLARLVDALVAALSQLGFGPGDTFTWDPNRSPFPGLGRLDADHAAVLFGRDAEIGACIGRLSGPRPLPLLVSGPSGSGKSSLIRAGVLPRIARGQGTRVLPVVEPGNSPLQRVALAFAAGGDGGDSPDAAALIADRNGFAFAVDRLVASGMGRVVLFLDQAEDLTTRADAAQVEDLVARLRAVDPDRLVVISAVRSASLEAWLQDPNLAWLGQADPVWVRPLDRSALREVIVGPAHVAGIRFEPEELVERIVDDTAQGNALPLLAALLEELTASHSRLSPAVITAARYGEVGPVARVIERRAQAASDDIRARRKVAETAVIDAYLRLVEMDDDGAVTSAEVPVDDVPPSVREIFDDLERHRLVTRDQRMVAPDGAGTGGPEGVPGAARTVEVVAATHEAIFRAWPAVAAAIRARRSDLEVRTWLRRDARTWTESGRGEAALTGGRLAFARDWANRNSEEVTSDIRSYVRTAIQQQQRRRLLTVAVPVLALVAVVVGGLAVLAFSEAQRADAARAEADALRIAGDARAAFDSRPDLGLLLAMEAATRSDAAEPAAMPLVALTQGPGPRRFEDVGQRLEAAALDRAGTRAVLRATDGFLLWDVAAGTSIATIAGHSDVLAMSDDGSTLAVAGPDGVAIHPWGSTEARVTCPSPGGTVTEIALSGSGDDIAVVSDDTADPRRSRVDVLRTSDCGVVSALTQVRGRVGAVALDAPGNRIALGSEEAGASLWELSTGRPFGALSDEPEIVRDLAFGSDDRLAAGTPNGELLLWDLGALASGPRRIRVHGTGQVVSVAFSSVDDSIVTGAASGELRRVVPSAEPPIGPPLLALPALDYEGRSVEPLDIAVEGSRAVSVDPSGRVVAWDLEGRPPLGPELAPGRLYDRLATMPDGSVLTADREGVYVVDARDGHIVSQVAVDGVTALGTGPSGWAVGTGAGEVLVPSGTDGALRPIAGIPAQPVVGLAALPDGGWAAASSKGRDRGTVTVLRGTGERRDVDLNAIPTAIIADGEWLYVGDMDGAIHVLSVADPGRPERLVEAHPFDIGSMALSPDGSTLATGSDDRTIATWEVGADGGLTERTRLRGHEERVRSLTFSPDGAWLASAGEEPAVRLWNLEAGAPVGDPITLAGGLPVVAFVPGADRQLLVAANRLDRWDMRAEQWPHIACGLIGTRRLADAERERYLGGEQPAATCS